MKQRQVLNIIKVNYDLVFGFLLFISYRFLFTWFLWRGRGVPPEPDDSFFYLASAHSFLHPQTFEEFRLIPFSIWLNLISLITRTNLEKAYQINFYLGPFIMFPAIYLFLKALETNRKVRLLLLLIITLYSGSGAYHGFYWVVPSYFQLAFFFIIFSMIISKNSQSFLKIFLFSTLFIFIHPTSIFASLIFFVYIFQVFLFDRKTFRQHSKRFLFIFLTILLCFSVYYLLGRSFSASGSPESFKSTLDLVKKFLSGNTNFISWPVVWKEYFSIFFSNPISIIAYISVFVFTFYLKNTRIIRIFASCLLLVILGALIPYGSRTLGFLWPITFILIGYGLYGLYQFLSNQYQVLKFIVVIPLICVVYSVSTLNQISINFMNNNKNYVWDRICPQKIKNDTVFFTGLEAQNAFSLYGLEKQNTTFLSSDNLPLFLKENSILVKTRQESPQKEKLSGFQRFLAKNITRGIPQPTTGSSNNVWTRGPLSDAQIDENLQNQSLKLNKYYNCGHFEILKVEKT